MPRHAVLKRRVTSRSGLRLCRRAALIDSKGGRMRIVLVDPSRAIQRAMTGLIVSGEQEVFACSQGQEALERIAADDEVGTLITSV